MQSRLKKWIAAVAIVFSMGISGCSGRRSVYVSGECMQQTEETGALCETAQSDLPNPLDSEQQTDMGYVHVCGAVCHPGVYRITDGMRVFEAIEAAGGFAADADTSWLNQAERLTDGQQLYVYTKKEMQLLRDSEAVSAVPFLQDGQEKASAAGDGRVNINTAEREELMTLDGIGEKKADSIIRYREENGGFSSIEEILEIPGIKDAVFSNIKDQITV